MTDTLRGHKIEHNGKEWVFSDNKESTVKTHRDRPCGYCNKHDTAEGHDACLGTLPGVINACCGHGNHDYGYIQFEDKRIVRRINATEIKRELRDEDDDSI